MKVNSNTILKILKVLTWAGFIGLCIKAGSILFSFWVSMYRNNIAAKNLYMGLDLSQLKEHSSSAYSILVGCIILIIAIQAFLFFVLLQIFKYVNLGSPFHNNIRKLILNLSVLSFAIGLLSKLTVGYSERLISKAISFPHLYEHIGIGDSFIFFGGILFFISMVFKKGIELQTDNDLTI